jgi:hypothetical protein
LASTKASRIGCRIVLQVPPCNLRPGPLPLFGEGARLVNREETAEFGYSPPP